MNDWLQSRGPRPYKRALVILVGIAICLLLSFRGWRSEEAQDVKPFASEISSVKTKITFVELGSVNCIPCRQMQPIMESIEQNYGDQIRVVFHDVWKDQNVGRQYGIRLIPTQVFLDENQNEIMRHEGFLPEATIDRFLQSRGLKISEEKAAQ